MNARAILLVLGLVGGGIQCVASLTRAADPCVASPTPTVCLRIENPNGTTFEVNQIPWICNETVSLAMNNAKHINSSLDFPGDFYSPYGYMIKTINGVTPGGTSYWALFVNDTYAQVGMDTFTLNPSDKITWKVLDSSMHTDVHLRSHQALMVTARAQKRLDAQPNKAPK